MAGAVIGLGTNLGDRAGNIARALDALSLLKNTRILKKSKIYETSPVGFLNQPDFLNGAVLLDTGFSPKALLGACMGIEAAMGRVRGIKNGPRRIDLDLLLYEGAECHDGELVVPHPRICERLFVLVPLFDLFPDGNAFGYPFALPEKSSDQISLYLSEEQKNRK